MRYLSEAIIYVAFFAFVAWCIRGCATGDYSFGF